MFPIAGLRIIWVTLVSRLTFCHHVNLDRGAYLFGIAHYMAQMMMILYRLHSPTSAATSMNSRTGRKDSFHDYID